MTILSLIFFVAETLITKGARDWFPELPYVLSLSILFMCLEFMRWRIWGIISGVVTGTAFCIASQATPAQFAVYCIGNMFAATVLIFIKTAGRKRIRDSVALTAVYVTLVYVAACLGRTAAAFCFGSGAGAFGAFAATDVLSWVFAMIGIMCVRNADGIFEDQKDYLLRLEEAELNK